MLGHAAVIEERVAVKIKTSELIGPALDWAVAVAEGYNEWEWDQDVSNLWLICRSTQTEHWLKGYYAPSTDWSQGGPIIDLEKIELKYMAYDRPPYWGALKSNTATHTRSAQIGPTPLIAAMRCFVASKLGDEVDVPEELLK